MSTRRAGAALVVTLMLSTPAMAQTQTGFEERRQDAATLVTSEIEAFSGHVERHCGIFTLAAGLDGPPAVTRKEVAKALRCVRDAQRQGRPAWAVWQVAGVDATIFDGVAATAVSAIHVVQNDGTGGSVRLIPCLRPRVDKDAAITCGSASALSARDLDKALDRLAHDIDRTAGIPLPDFATPGDRALGPAAVLARAVEIAQQAAHEAGNPTWPRCPRHFDHPLAFRDGWWFCEREAAYIAELGGLWRVVPRARR